jgi:hypothetical protein
VTRNEHVRRRIVNLLLALTKVLERLVRVRLLSHDISIDLAEPVWSNEGAPENGSDCYEIAGEILWGTKPSKR